MFGIVANIVIGLLRSLFGLTPGSSGSGGALGSTRVVGTLIVQQPGGVAGTDEIQVSHDGAIALLENKDAGGSSDIQLQCAGGERFTVARAYGFEAFTGTGARRLSFDGVLRLGSGGAIGWGSNVDPRAASQTVSLYYLTDGVLGVGSGVASGTGWLQNSAGESRVTSDVTNATTTFANITGLSATLVAGRKYRGRIVIACDDSTAVDGIKFDLNGGTATFTSIEVGVTANVQGATAGVTVSTAIATALTFTAMSGTGRHFIVVEFTGVCNTGGTLIPRMAQNAHTTGTATVRVNTNMAISDIL